MQFLAKKSQLVRVQFYLERHKKVVQEKRTQRMQVLKLQVCTRVVAQRTPIYGIRRSANFCLVNRGFPKIVALTFSHNVNALNIIVSCQY